MGREFSNTDAGGSLCDAPCVNERLYAGSREWDEFGRSLRELYAGVVAQPLPSAFVSLLNRLDAGEKEGASPL